MFTIEEIRFLRKSIQDKKLDAMFNNKPNKLSNAALTKLDEKLFNMYPASEKNSIRLQNIIDQI